MLSPRLGEWGSVSMLTSMQTGNHKSRFLAFAVGMTFCSRALRLKPPDFA